jgi:hypothetical protein
METNILSKVLLRLPNLITLLFSLTLVTGFRLMNDRFHWNTSPTFDITQWNDTLILLSFLTTFLFIVTAWLGFSVLIERVPYKDNFNRFLFDTARFTALFPLLMWSFTVEFPEKYQLYIWGLSAWHLIMTIWYLWPILFSHSQRTGYSSDLKSHATIMVIYFILGLAYYLFIAKDWANTPNQTMRVALVLLTLFTIIFWSIRRLRNLQSRLILEANVH